MKIDSTIFGIPWALIIFVILNAIIVLTPLILLQRATMDRLDTAKIERTQILNRINTLIPTVTPIVSVTPLPSPTTFQGVKPATKSGQVK